MCFYYHNRMKYLKLYIFSVLLTCWVCGADARQTKVRGRVVDISCDRALPLVDIRLDGTDICTSTNSRGCYTLEIEPDVDSLSLTISLEGYSPQSFEIKKGCFNIVDTKLIPYNIHRHGLDAGCGSVDTIMAQVLANKPFNDLSLLKDYSCGVYAKTGVGIENLELKDLKREETIDKYGFIFENMDTSVMTNRSYILGLVSESKRRKYYSRERSIDYQEIEASRISGFENNRSLAKLMSELDSDINLYDNYISILKVSFVSPLSASARRHYKYYLLGSVEHDSRKSYRIRFEPKNIILPVFEGELWIDSASYALCRADISMARGSDINWINNLNIELENRLYAEGVWFKESEKQRASFSIVPLDSSELYSLIVHRRLDYDGLDLSGDFDARVVEARDGVFVESEALVRDNTYWNGARPCPLSEAESRAYSLVDSLRRAGGGSYRSNSLASVVFGGYLKSRYLGFGPYYKLFSFNDVEKARFQFGVKTLRTFSQKLRMQTYVAYGIKDERLKAGFKAEYMLRRDPTRKFSLEIKHDLVQLGEADDALTEGNIFSSIFAKDQKRMSLVDKLNLGYEHQWREGINASYNIDLQKIYSTLQVPLITRGKGELHSVNASAVSVATRFSWDEITYNGRYEKHYLYSTKPRFTIKLTGGLKNVLPSDYNFLRVEGVGQYTLSIPPIGESKYTLSAGKIFGKVPFLLLKLHEGNGTYFYSQTAFSCMSYYEFASDTWVSLMYEHDFRGLIIKSLPLLRKTSWRTVLTFKGVWGTISERNNGSLANTSAVLLFPTGMSELNKPYMEAGVGIKNIFRLLRIDAIWRLTHRSKELEQGADNFTINLGVAFVF